MLDCGLRPEKCHRLKWSQYRNSKIEIYDGKTSNSRRSVPAERARKMLANRHATVESDWIFPAPTKAGHIDSSSLKKQHAAAIKTAKLERFVLYMLRHTALTRWAEARMDLFTLKRLAGHASLATTQRYIHMNDTHTETSDGASFEGSKER